MDDYMKEAERLADAYAVAYMDFVRCGKSCHEEARAALIAHIQRGVPEGYVAVPRFLAENHRNLTDVPRYQRILDDCLASAPDQFRDATKMMPEPADDRIAAAIHYPECWDTAAYPTVESALAEVFAHYRCTEHDAPAEVPMPEPDGFKVTTPDGLTYFRSTPTTLPRHTVEPLIAKTQALSYGDACEAAGYARGWKEKYENPWQDGYTSGYNDGVQDGIRTASLRGEECDLPPRGWRCTRVKGHSGPCAAVECPWEIEIVERAMARLRGEVKP